MGDAKLTPEEQAEADSKSEVHSGQQPYATELDDRELENAQKQKRPVDPQPAKPNSR